MICSLSRRKFIAGTISAMVSSAAGSAPSHQPELDDKIGQMLMANFAGLRMPEHVRRLIRDDHLGGVLLFENNFSTAARPKESLQKLIAELQGASSTPLLIAMDHEGGAVNRLKQKYGFPQIRSAQECGEQKDVQLTKMSAESIAQALSSVGVNHNFAPVVDLRLNATNPIAADRRCYAADPDSVIAHARQFIRAHREKRIITTLKHFPGHGSSMGDTHAGYTDVTKTWQAKELRPYERLIAEDMVDSIMTAHIYQSNLDSVYPASLSHAIITQLLRQKLGFDGVVISDDLLMAAIRNRYSLAESVRQAVQAGNDILLFTTTADDLLPRVKNIIRQHVKDGVISQRRIDESYKRIARLKDRLA
ncbi:glycoside hydrolase family 3 protein [candidate division KSB1 bacterium]|nr:glycoside hydrolase family 3 protein [candidate division KSB1 bacterium]RQW04329.1 MAG: glycoside hydrolase family 3 protein [candidate division KSB1 bacterium]